MNKKLFTLSLLAVFSLMGCGRKALETEQENKPPEPNINEARANKSSFSGVKVKLKESVYRYHEQQKSKVVTSKEGAEHTEVIKSGWKLGPGFSDDERLVVMQNNQNSDLKFYLQYSDCTEIIKIENEEQVFLKNQVEDFEKCDASKTRLMAVNVEEDKFKDTYCFERRKQEEVNDKEVLAAYVKCIEPSSD